MAKKVLKEIDLKVLIFEEIPLGQIGGKLGGYLDYFFSSNSEELRKEHYSVNDYGSLKYSFNYLWPHATNKIYKKGGVYNFQIRSFNDEVIKTLEERIVLWNDKTFKVLKIDVKEINPFDRKIERVFTTTPLIIKNDFGYWRGKVDVEEFEKRLRGNMIKKYNALFDKDIRNVRVFSKYSIDNEKPISLSYKDINLLGDKVTLFIDEDPVSQEVACAALGTGLGENCTRIGAGYLNFKYRR